MTLVSRFFYFFILVLIISCQEIPNTYTIIGYTQGTTYTVKYNSDNNKILSSDIDSLLNVIDLSMSTYKSNSTISLINNNQAVILDALIEEVIDRSIDICHQTNGMFDITVAPLVDYWGFGNKSITKEFKSIDKLSHKIGCDLLYIENHRLIKSDEVSIDLNGIAQGFSVDHVSNFLLKNGVSDFMVEIGGEVRCSGNNLGNNWKIGIDTPTDQNNDFVYILKLKDISLATSGSYRKYYYKDSIKISHTMNPKTLQPANNRLISATIVYDDCMSADAYATACMSMGFEDAKYFLENNNILGSLIYVNYRDTIHYLSEDFSSLLHRSPGSAPQ